MLFLLSYLGRKLEPGAGLEPAISHLQNERIAVYACRAINIWSWRGESNSGFIRTRDVSFQLNDTSMEPRGRLERPFLLYGSSVSPSTPARPGADDGIRTHGLNHGKVAL